MNDQKNMLLAIVLSAIVLIGWQIFFGLPQMEAAAPEAGAAANSSSAAARRRATQPGAVPQEPGRSGAGRPRRPGASAAPGPATRPAGRPDRHPRSRARRPRPRVGIDTARLAGSIGLRGGRIDDLSLLQYRETVNPKSPPVVLLSPSRSPMPFYAEFGWVPAAGTTVKLPDGETLWKQDGKGTLGIGRPITLIYDNGEGLEFRRTISVDDKYMFTLRDEVVNRGSEPVTLYPYALVSRHGQPKLEGFYILHEGLVGMLGDKGLQEITYSDIEKQKRIPFKVTNAWLGITDKYWAATLLPDNTGDRAGAVLVRTGRHHQDLSGRISARSADHRARRHRRRQRAPVRRRQGGRDRRRLRQAIQAQPLRAPDRLGLFLLHHQAAVPGDGLDVPLLRQFRRRHPARSP